MDYFISDLHFGHDNIIKLCDRPFTSIEEMDEVLISAWNAKVKKKADTVYIVGDLIWEKADPNKYLKMLNGKKVLITGNHDKKWLEKQDYSKYFEQIVPYLEIRSNNVDITLCHYPMLEWKNSRKLGSKKLGYHIYGHIHNRYCDDYKKLYMIPHALNAGVDINGFAPVSLDELIKNNETYKLSKLSSLVDKAEFLASKYHLYQLYEMDKKDKPYIEHLKYVSQAFTDEDCKIVGWLHDIVEDTNIDIELLKRTFSERIVNAILSMTHKSDESYFDYIDKLSKNSLARQVKLQDLRCNMNLNNLKNITQYAIDRVEKYKKAMTILLKGEHMKKEYQVVGKIIESLKEYPTPIYDLDEFQKIFDEIQKVLKESNLAVTKDKYEIENYFVKYYFKSDKVSILKKAVDRANDITLRLQCISVRAYLKEDAVCFEVVNPQKSIVGLSELLNQPIQDQKAGDLYCVLGKANGSALNVDVTKTPHLLIVGGTGSGKTVLSKQIILSLVSRYSPDQVKFLLVDPKGVDFNCFEGLPHLIDEKVVCETEETLSSLEKLVSIMDNRYERFSQLDVLNIDDYNEKAKAVNESTMEKIIVFIDEFADLILSNKARFEKIISELTSRCRVAGIHLILSTQAASKSTLTPTIVNCILSKIVLRVNADHNFKLIPNSKDVCSLLGNGDLLFKHTAGDDVVRALAGYVSNAEIKNAVSIIKAECEK